MCASTLWLFSSSTRNIALGRDSRIVPSSTMASSFGLGRVGLFRTVAVTAENLLRTREADLGRGAMLSPAKVNAKWPGRENHQLHYHGKWGWSRTLDREESFQWPQEPHVGAPSPPCYGPTPGV